MSFKEISFYHFRNLKDGKISQFKKNNFIIGPNGQGKTNFLEALYLLTYCSSFKELKDQNFISLNQNECKINGVRFNNEFEDHFSFFQNARSKEFKINDKTLKDKGELLEYVPAIVFKHDDIFLINGSPEIKRNFFDQILTHTHITYLDLFRKYKKIVKQRNFCLKMENYSVLDALDIQLFEIGKELTKIRAAFIESINLNFNNFYHKFASDDYFYKIEYKASLENLETIDFIKRKRPIDIKFKTTTVGPHRDNYLILQNDIDFSRYASTGQKRVLSLILKLFQAQLIGEKSQKFPVLLFDDVLLELDREKKIAVLKNLPNYSQAFFTVLPSEEMVLFDMEDKKIMSIKNGEISSE